MPWSLAQRTRLAHERQTLESYFHRDKVKWINPTHDTQVEVKVTCRNERCYTLRVYIVPDFPNACPSMVIVTPCGLLRRKDGSLLSVMNRNDHILSNKDGYTQICHFRPSMWRDNNTIFQVIIRGMTWLEAYELHLQTGDSLDQYLQAGESLLLEGGTPEL